MVSQLPKAEATNKVTPSEVYYPDSDGQPMASNTEQYRWIVTIQQNLDWLLSDAFVAGDLFWYPVEGRSDISVAPDVMVAIGRPKGKRLSYKQWVEENTAPQVVFEILSPSNTRQEMDKKLLFFERYGVDEYYLYDTESRELSGFLRGDFALEPILDILGWTSPALKIRFEKSDNELRLLDPDGSPFLSSQEVIAQKALAEERAKSAEERAESAEERAESAEERAESAEERAESAEERAESAEERANKLAETLKSLGVDPDQI